ncbi:SDR family NAD(P)-dependent oxidoreductase [Caldithrix abyssi]
MQTYLIVGCTSGIGKALTEILVTKGHRVLGAGRSQSALEELSRKFPDLFSGKTLDIQQEQKTMAALDEWLDEQPAIDVAVIASSIVGANPELEWEIEKNIIQTNVLGWAAVCNRMARYFEQQGRGHLVGITSLAKYLASVNPAYIATKAFEGRYLDGLRSRLEPRGVHVTEIMPGFVETPMIADRNNAFLVISPEKAAKSILRAIKKRKRRAVISTRWKIFRLLLPHLPAVLLVKLRG